MKKYLHACELGGSIYGKKKEVVRRVVRPQESNTKNGLMNSYNNLYKKQYVTMEKLFKHHK